jgi:hypothetical protein
MPRWAAFSSEGRVLPALALRRSLDLDSGKRRVSFKNTLLAARGLCRSPRPAQGSLPRGAYTMGDIGLSTFSLFFMAARRSWRTSASSRRGRAARTARPCSPSPPSPATKTSARCWTVRRRRPYPLCFKAIETPGMLTPFQRLDGRILIALNGTEHHCSRKVHCTRCSTRKRSDGGTEYFHAFLGASFMAPGHQHVLPLPPEFIVPQDGAQKQDCERNAAKRWPGPPWSLTYGSAREAGDEIPPAYSPRSFNVLNERLQPRAQFRAPQEHAGERIGDLEPAGVRLSRWRLPWPCQPGGRQLSRQVPLIGSSSTCGPSPHTSCFRIGRTCSARSPKQTSYHREPGRRHSASTAIRSGLYRAVA